jgi:SAM-dependent methyltransferase
VTRRADILLQEKHFDQRRNQYPEEWILHPPPHTRLEIEAVVTRLRAAGIGHGDRVVDFGAGTGRLTIPLLREGYAVTSVDVSTESLASIEALARRLSLDGLSTSDRLPEPGSAAAVVGCDILHHVDMASALPALREVVRPNGHVILSEPGGFNPCWYLYVSLALDWRVERRFVHGNIPRLRRALRRSAFTSFEIQGFGLAPTRLFNRFSALLDANARAGDLPILRWFAYRYILDATVDQSNSL